MYQWFNGLEILDFVITEVEMRELRTVFEDAEAIADPIVAQLQLLQRGQLGEPLKGRQAHVDEAQRLQARVLVGQALDLRGSRIVQIQFFHLEKYCMNFGGGKCLFPDFSIHV